ncbi:MAG TPA: protein kinase [Bryobacteraceae bacterium]|nr:protein kinase [Bryobacteraceae bacterium]
MRIAVMQKCPSCATETADDSRFCSKCGEDLTLDALATRTVAAAPSRATPKTPASGSTRLGTSSSSHSDSCFVPGTVLAGRYRIVSMLGKGGMGEVYRADDLTLDQPVALKFLPDGALSNQNALARFKNEVRVARQVSHPNVCRVYDVGEIDGHIFLSMEYVDGEDLGSLLRRIGRVPADKALEISRKLCAGLAAAHEKGVLHRDLKPSNVMLDSHGQVLLTDFGLAGLADQITGNEVRNGTPQYMAPEQLAGKEVTTRSDIYSLGLVFYEIFTGKRPFEANSMAELMQAQSKATPISISTLVRDLDPAVERVVLRCLDPDPSRRPASALAVAAGLPGGDPLQAALAAGETPSPEMVAAAGEGVGLAPRIALPLLAVVVLGVAAYYVLGLRNTAMEHVEPRYSPEVLSQKARDIIQKLGFPETPADTAYGYFWKTDYLNYVQRTDKPAPSWEEVFRGRPQPLQFWYRESPYPLTGVEFHDDLLTPGVVMSDDPAPVLSGMLEVKLDAQGRLLYFQRTPEQKIAPAAGNPAMDWSPLFAAANLDVAQLHPVDPEWTWLATSDIRAAWAGVWPGGSRPLRVEAAAFRGKPVAFALMGPWTDPDRMPARESSNSDRGQFLILIVISFAVALGTAVLVNRNAKKSAGDAAGATRLAGWVGAVQIGLWLSRSHIVLSMGTFGMFLIAVATAIFYAFVVRSMYFALEPHVRRRWPQTMISWSAVLTGHWRDPIVGRDVLAGSALAIAVLVINRIVDVTVPTTDPPSLGTTDILLGIRGVMTVYFRSIPHGIRDTLLFFFVIFVLRVLLRNQWLATGGFVLVFTALEYTQGNTHIQDIVAALIVFSLIAGLVFRFGLLALAAFIFVQTVMISTQLTTSTSAWYFGGDVFILASVVALAAWGFHTSIAGRKLWKQDLLG